MAAPPADGTWVPTFTEEFERSTLDPTVWSAGPDTGRSAEAAHLLVSDGILHLITRHHQGGRREWTSAFLATRRFRQTYGYFEVRMRLAHATGMTNLIRLSSDQPNRPGGFEITLAEGRYPGEVDSGVLRHDAPTLMTRHALAGIDLSADYHVYGLEWLPEGRGRTKLTWYLDDKPLQVAVSDDCARPVRLWLGTQVTTWSGPFAPAISGASMDVDFIRIYQLHSLMVPPRPRK